MSAANWEEVVLGLNPSVTTLKGEYANAGQSFSGGLNMPQLWGYWRNRGIDGATATKIVPYTHDRANTELVVSDFGALIAEDVTSRADYMGTVRHGAGYAIMVVDGFDPKGPLVVFQATTIQMTWAQWNSQVRGLWGITASTNGSTTTTTTPVGSSTATITFNANGGSGVIANETDTVGTSAALTLNTLTRTGYTFGGWNTNANGSGTNYANGATYTFATSTTLYAQWTVSAPTTATITFNSNGCSGYMANETEPLGVTAALTPNAFTCSGYTFTGWNTASNGSGTSYTDGELVQFTGSVTLYSLWTATPTSITFTGSTTPNWSGYVLPSDSAVFTDVSAQWTVPTLNCADTPNAVSFTWVGIGGYGWSTGGTSGTLLQTGTNDGCVNGVQQDYGWFEEYPSDPNYSQGFANFPVSPGDTMEAYVFQTSGGSWETLLNNLTTGLSAIMVTGEGWGVSPTPASGPIAFTYQGTTTDLSYSGGYTAEWVTEDPTGSSGSYSPFANYGTVTFTNLETNLPSGWLLPNSDGVEMVQNGAVLSVPSTVSGGGFTVTYMGP